MNKNIININNRHFYCILNIDTSLFTIGGHICADKISIHLSLYLGPVYFGITGIK
jgi:hypothetical protein